MHLVCALQLSGDVNMALHLHHNVIMIMIHCAVAHENLLVVLKEGDAGVGGIAYKAVNNEDTMSLHIKHYTIQTICIHSIVFWCFTCNSVILTALQYGRRRGPSRSP